MGATAHGAEAGAATAAASAAQMAAPGKKTAAVFGPAVGNQPAAGASGGANTPSAQAAAPGERAASTPEPTAGIRPAAKASSGAKPAGGTGVSASGSAGAQQGAKGSGAGMRTLAGGVGGTAAARAGGADDAVCSSRATSRKPKPKKGGMAAKRIRTRRIHRGVRWFSQAVFFLLAPTLSSAGFNGVKAVFEAIGAGNAVELSAFVMLMVALLAFTCVFGRFFCGYACAFGTLGDVVYMLFTPLRRLLKIPDKVLPAKVQRALQYLKYLVLAGVCALCFAGWWGYVSPHSPWTTFGVLLELNVEGLGAAAIAVLAVLVVGMALVERFFCQFLCPFGALFSLMPVLPFSAYRRDASKCSPRCGMCRKACPVNIFPDADEFCAGECISCGRCCDGCPTTNIAIVKLGRHASDDKSAARRARAGGFLANLKVGVLRIKGDEVACTLVKMLALLVVCWLLGVLNYVPSVAEVQVLLAAVLA